MIELSEVSTSMLQIVHHIETFGRRLQSSGNTNSTGQSDGGGSGSGGGGGGSSDRYEFVAFLLWYIFLVLCCVIPTCCAYHRRRMMEQRLALHQSTLRQNSNNLYFLTSLQQQNTPVRQNNSEHVQHERLALLREELKGTTMIVKEESIIQPSKSFENANTLKRNSSADNDIAVAVMESGGYDQDTSAEEYGLIRLPPVGVNTDRTVPGVCTICLCAYEDGDEISWSTEESCQHAFHTDCIIPWLAKKEEPRCPVCRQEFCPAAIVPEDTFDIDLDRENSFLQSFSHALAMSQLYRPYPSESTRSYEQTRNAITLQLATLALENQARLEQTAIATPITSENNITTTTATIEVAQDSSSSHDSTNATPTTPTATAPDSQRSTIETNSPSNNANNTNANDSALP